MLLSLGIIIIVGYSLSQIMEKIKMPSLIGMMITGVILGPYALDLIAPEILSISSELREIALIIILIRAGLSLNLKKLKEVGRPAVLMCFVPAIFELVTITLIGPKLLNISYLQAGILGSVIAAVSPAVVVPSMINISKKGYGSKKGIPELIMAGASVDDIIVIVIFTSLISIYQGGTLKAGSFLAIPVSILSGVLAGIILGVIVTWLFKFFLTNTTIKAMVLLGVGIALMGIENITKDYFSFSGLLGAITLGAMVLLLDKKTGEILSSQYETFWIIAQLFLFVLIGSATNITYIKKIGFSSLILIGVGLIGRIIGVFISLIKTNLNLKERLFCAISYLPKATVQAAIGGIPLSLGIKGGEIILAVAVLSIIITAPVGAIFIDKSYKRLLTK